jgi:hypothetical protein
MAYTRDQIQSALRLEALSLDLHRSLHATETEALNEDDADAEPWFRFSAEEWRPLGELPRRT